MNIKKGKCILCGHEVTMTDRNLKRHQNTILCMKQRKRHIQRVILCGSDWDWDILATALEEFYKMSSDGKKDSMVRHMNDNYHVSCH